MISSSAEETLSSLGHIVEDTSGNKGDEQVTDEHGKSDGWITSKQGERSPERNLDLLKVGQVERRATTLRFGLIGSARLEEFGCVLAIEGVLVDVVVNLDKKRGAMLARIPRGAEVVCSAGRLPFPALTDDSLGWVSHRGQEIRSGLLLGTNEPQALKVGTGVS